MGIHRQLGTGLLPVSGPLVRSDINAPVRTDFPRTPYPTIPVAQHCFICIVEKALAFASRWLVALHETQKVAVEIRQVLKNG
jgi:hypothetical protein